MHHDYDLLVLLGVAPEKQHAGWRQWLRLAVLLMCDFRLLRFSSGSDTVLALGPRL